MIRSLVTFARTDAAARRSGSRQYRFSPLGHDLPLYGAPRTETEITHFAEPVNVPLALTRGHLARHLDLYYGDQADGAPASATGPTTVATGPILEARDLTKSYPLGETTVDALRFEMIGLRMLVAPDSM